MPRCPACRSIATWKLLNNSEAFTCGNCSCTLARRRDPHAWSLLIGIGGGSIMGLGLYLGVELEGRFVFSWCFLLGAAAGYLFVWSQMRLRQVGSVYQRRL